ncbi:GNAT family N-acetyltransferase [Actinoplanes sp. NPDC049316]|uniref:GNAT family N-acetyltransferase n=1 Tax=Actinoplanes sp. NPDC049316 TaxID=3154727 RepID=UPI00343849FC
MPDPRNRGIMDVMMISLDRLPADEDPLLRWAAQDMRAGVRAWALGDAAAVACPDVSRRDRLALRGGVPDVVALVDRIRPEVEGFHAVGDEKLVAAIPGLVIEGRFGWMDTTEPTGLARRHEPRWLDGDDEEVAAFLDEHHPGSYAYPGGSGVTRWAGIRADTGELLAVGADAWSMAEIGFLAGVATRSDARGRGLGRDLCAFLTDELIAGRERVALMVDHDNAAAVGTYEKLGYTMRRIAAATFQDRQECSGS